MAKKDKSKSKDNKNKEKDATTLSLGKYTAYFEKLENGKKVNLKDLKSDQNAFMPIEVCDKKVYMTEPDGKLIQNIDNQQKCDFMIYCQNLPQTCFIELKGANISNKKDYNPYDQIIDTIKFIRQQEELKELVSANTERHAFIVSNGRQKIPKGIETKERALWQMLFQNGKNRRILELVHYVKVTPADRYSNKERIVCSPKSPVKIPFSK